MWVGLNGRELKNIGGYLLKAGAFAAGVLAAGYIGLRCCDSSLVARVTPMNEDTVEYLQRDMRALEEKISGKARRDAAKGARNIYEGLRDSIDGRLD